MFVVHSGAALHRHEYSVPIDQSSNSNQRRTPLTRSAFSTPISPSRPPYDRPVPRVQKLERPTSEYIPRAYEHTVRFHEPESDTMSEDGQSVSNSVISGTTAAGSQRRKSVRTNTSFRMAHPAPTLTQKQRLLHIRPKLLLQLQRLSADRRPNPVIDVLPSTVVVPRLMKKFPRMFRGKAELGANDVMVVKSETYDLEDDHRSEGSESDEDGLSNRELLAVICQARKDHGGSAGKAEIVLDDGTLWSATPMQNGLFEFESVDEKGNKTMARWVKRNKKRGSVDFSELVDNSHDSRFTFSIIDPRTRRHPIMATLTPNKLDIPDFYTAISSPAVEHPPTPPIGAFPREFDHSASDYQSERQPIIVDEKMKSLIQVTGIWVALRQDWSPYFKYNDTMALPSPSSRSRATSGIRGRSLSLSISPDAYNSSSATFGSVSDSHHGTLAGIGGKFRRTRVPGSPVSTTTASSIEKPPLPPKRAISSGSAFMQRAAAKRSGPPSTILSENEAEVIINPPSPITLGESNASVSAVLPPVGHRSNSPDSSPATPIHTTRSQRQVQSLYMPTGLAHNEDTQRTRYSSEIMEGGSPAPEQKQKTSRWKAWTRFFRRAGSRA